MVVGTGDRWSLCYRPGAAPGNRNIILHTQGACTSISTALFTLGKPQVMGISQDLLIQPCRTEKVERTFYRGVLDASIKDRYLDLHKLHTDLHQSQSHEDESIRVSAQADFSLVFKKAQVPFLLPHNLVGAESACSTPEE